MLAIAGGKGGCGKTTTALGVARALRRHGRAPLVVDTDVEMPDLHVVADVPSTPGLRAVAAGASPSTGVHRSDRLDGVRVLPADGVEADRLPVALDRLARHADPVVLDCPAGAARDAARPLRAADRTLLVTRPSPSCLRDTAKTAAMARALDAPPVGVVVVDAPAGPARAESVDATDARRVFDCALLARVPAVDSAPLAAEAVRTAHERLERKLRERNA